MGVKPVGQDWLQPMAWADEKQSISTLKKVGRFFVGELLGGPGEEVW